MTQKEKQPEVSVTFTKEELDYLEFYVRWSTKRLFGDYDPDRNHRRVLRSVVKKARTALAEIDTKRKAEVETLERMLGTGEQEARS